MTAPDATPDPSPDVEAGVADLVERARRLTGSPSAQRKHHLVPNFYLRRWEDGGRLQVTDIDAGRSWQQAASKAMRETDFYSLDDPDVDPDDLPPLLFEVALGETESLAADVIAHLVEHGTRGVTRQQQFHLAVFLAFQYVRGRSFRAEMRANLSDLYRRYYTGWTDDSIRDHLAERGIDVTDDVIEENREFLDRVAAGEVTWTRRQAHEIGLTGGAANEIGEHFFARRWEVWTTPPILVTCDEPVVVIAGPGAPRDERGGLVNAGAIIFPLSPSRLLVMPHEDMRQVRPMVLDHVETAEINREILANAYQTAFDRPGRRTAQALSVPARPTEAWVSAPAAIRPTADGGTSVIYRQFRPTRWFDQPAPDWPVRRWWDGFTVQHPPQPLHDLDED